ncbi:MAG: ribonuclease H-like domain-containing protein [Nitrososphaera sp.]
MQRWAKRLQEPSQASPIKLLFLDIETAPNTSFTWGLHNQFVGLDQIVEPGYTLCFAAKWLGSPDVMFHSRFTDGPVGLAHAAWDLLDEADAVCTYNGKKFDLPVLKRDFVLHSLTPPSPTHSVDLYQTVRSQFRFASNKLDFVAQQLGCGAKVQHKGMDLWSECMRGQPEAWAHMEAYNRQDVTLLESLYWRLLPFIKGHPNRGLWIQSEELTCPHCGSHKMVETQPVHKLMHSYKGYMCQDCGAHSSSRLCTGKPAGGVLRV